MESPRGDLKMDFLTKITNITRKPEIFLGAQENVAKELTTLLKIVYDHTKTAEPKHLANEALPELIIQDFDEEQIWQELELQNDFKVNSIMFEAATLAVHQEKLALKLIVDTDEEDEENKEESHDEEWEKDVVGDDNDTGDDDDLLDDDDDFEDAHGDLKDADGDFDDDDDFGDDDDVGDDDDTDNDGTDKRASKPGQKRPKMTSIVDDKFFKLEELNQFLDQEDKKEEASRKDFDKRDDESDYDSDDVDLFDDFQGGDESLPKYSDFFSAPDGNQDSGNNGESMMVDGEEDMGSESEGVGNKKKRVRFNLSKDDDAEIETNEVPVPKSNESKSNFEIAQERLRNRINQLESVALSEKPWQMKGEVSATLRPDNSLLEEVVDFQMATRPAPIFTEVTTLSLETIIKRRIARRTFNDVVRQVKTPFVNNVFKKTLVLNEEKSKQSLAEVYEQDYAAQLTNKQVGTEKAEYDEQREDLQVVRKEMASLFVKLDALANYHFMPKPSAPELRIITNVPAVNMEEVAPIATTSANLLAPEEVKAGIKGDLMGKDERTTTDKKRERRHKKLMQHYIAKGNKTKTDMFTNNLPGFKQKKAPKTKKEKLLDDVAQLKNVSKMKLTKGVKVTKSSTSFFSNLQDKVQQVKTLQNGEMRQGDERKIGKKKLRNKKRRDDRKSKQET